ncbi:MAG: AraC family transcriptional regulator [Bacteroidota bacterium]
MLTCLPMRIFSFARKKYGPELLMDMGRMEETPHFFYRMRPHATDFFEVLIFQKGNGYLQLDTDQIAVQDSSFIFLSPYQKRQWQVVQKDIKGFFLIFERDFLANFFADHLFVYRLQYFFNRKVPTYLIPNERLFPFKHDIFDEIFHEIHHYRKDSEHLLRSILYYILIKLNRAFCGFHQLETDTIQNHLAFRFKEELEQHIRELQRVEEYAQRLGISRITLNRAVKEQFGQTASQMIKDRLIYEIKTELMYTHQTVAEIAYGLRISEPNNLIRLFKAKTGLSPIAFRKVHQIEGRKSK